MKTVVSILVVGVVLLCVSGSGPHAYSQTTIPDDNKTKTLADRIAALEKMVAKLDRRVQDEKLINSLHGKWIEESYVRSGERQIVVQDEPGEIEVAWNLTHDASKSGRWILKAEPYSVNFGAFSVDTSKSPAWIDFQVPANRNAKSYTVRGIVNYTYKRAEISIPGKLFDGDTFLDPPRPDGFESTAENGYAVHKLIRESYKKTGVW